MRTRLREAVRAAMAVLALLVIAGLSACGQSQGGHSEPDSSASSSSASSTSPKPSASLGPSANTPSGASTSSSGDLVATQYVVDQAPTSARTIPAWGASPATVEVFSVSFRSEAGERRLIRGDVWAYQPDTTSDEILMASVLLNCSNVAHGYPGTATGTENVIKGSTIPMQEAFVHVAARTGTTTCVVTAKSARPAPANPDIDPDSNFWRILTGSHLTVSKPVATWSRTVASKSVSRKMLPGKYWTPVVGKQTIPQGTEVEVLAQQSVTSCTAGSGSRDSSTDGTNLCAQEWTVDRQGSFVRVDLYVQQLTPDAEHSCTAPVKVGTQIRDIDRWKHHAIFNVTGKWTTMTTAACGPRIVYYARTTIVSGAQAVVHAPTTRLTVVG